MIKKIALTFNLFLLAPATLFAADFPVSNFDVPVVQPTGNWWDTLAAAIVPLLIAALTALSAYLSSFVNRKLKEAKTAEYSSWYGMALNLAGIAVRYAETSFGPDTQNGAKKKEAAINWLMARLKALDPKINEHIDREDVAAFVDAAYHDVFVAVSPLAQPVLPKPGQ